MNTVKDEVLGVLRRKKVKLWLPPYFVNKSSNRAELETLASSIGTDDAILTALMELQTHALEKLQAKRSIDCLQLKLLGLQEEGNTTGSRPVFTPTWAERSETAQGVLTLHHVDPDITVEMMVQSLLAGLQVDAVRLVYKGKNLSNDSRARLGDIMSAAPSPVKVLCLVSYHHSQNDEERDMIPLIRQVATTLQMDITDQHGKLVPMKPEERAAFLTALGLQRLGLQQHSTLSSSLMLLLEADKEWDNVTPQWRDTVDNYGLLQLDIAWVCLKLESMDNLTDVTQRLELAEKVLRKQVHTNFVTLALTQADMGNAVPPLSAVFCRLFLLQGVAFRYSQNETKSKERFEWARVLCHSLRTVSSNEKVFGLCEALGISESQAISALRRTNGISDQAATLIEEENANEDLQRERRSLQRKLGLCENTIDHVDLDLVSQLQTVLGLSSTVPPHHQQQQAGSDEMDPHFMIAAGMLRLTNNDLQMSIDVYQEVDRNIDSIRQRVSALDLKLEKLGLEPKRKRSKTKVEVDEVSLTMLISMGVNETLAKSALRKSENNVESALSWLTSNQGNDNNEGDGMARLPSTDSEESMEEGDEDIPDHEPRNEAQSNQDTRKAELEVRIQRDLGKAVQERDLEKEYFGSKLDEEWELLRKFGALE